MRPAVVFFLLISSMAAAKLPCPHLLRQLQGNEYRTHLKDHRGTVLSNLVIRGNWEQYRGFLERLGFSWERGPRVVLSIPTGKALYQNLLRESKQPNGIKPGFLPLETGWNELTLKQYAPLLANGRLPIGKLRQFSALGYLRSWIHGPIVGQHDLMDHCLGALVIHPDVALAFRAQLTVWLEILKARHQLGLTDTLVQTFRLYRNRSLVDFENITDSIGRALAGENIAADIEHYSLQEERYGSGQPITEVSLRVVLAQYYAHLLFGERRGRKAYHLGDRVHTDTAGAEAQLEPLLTEVLSFPQAYGFSSSEAAQDFVQTLRKFWEVLKQDSELAPVLNARVERSELLNKADEMLAKIRF